MRARSRQLLIISLAVFLLYSSIYPQNKTVSSQINIFVNGSRFVVSGIVNRAQEQKIKSIIANAFPANKIQITLDVSYSTREFRGSWENDLKADLERIATWKSGMFVFNADKEISPANFVRQMQQADVERVGDGSSMKLIDGSKKATFIYLFATWCVPCFGQLPVLNELSNRYKEEGVDFVALDSDDQEHKSDIIKFVERFKIQYRVGKASSGLIDTIADFNRFDGIPQGILIVNGEVRLVILGGGQRSNQMLAEKLGELFGAK